MAAGQSEPPAHEIAEQDEQTAHVPVYPIRTSCSAKAHPSTVELETMLKQKEKERNASYIDIAVRRLHDHRYGNNLGSARGVCRTS